MKCPLQAQCQTLSMQLQDAQAKLLAEREETRAVTRQCEFTENELRDVKEQLTGLARTCEMEQRQSSKFEASLG